MIYSIIFSFYWVRVGKNCGKKFYKLSALRSEFCDVFSRFLRVYDTTMAFYDQPFVTFRIFAAVDSNFPYPLQFVQYFRLFQTQPLVRHFNFKLDADAAPFLKSGISLYLELEKYRCDPTKAVELVQPWNILRPLWLKEIARPKMSKRLRKTMLSKLNSLLSKYYLFIT